MRLEMRIGAEPATYVADSAKPDATRAENCLQRIFRASKDRARASFADQCRTHSHHLGTRNAVVNCIHVNCISFNGGHAVLGVSYTRLQDVLGEVGLMGKAVA